MARTAVLLLSLVALASAATTVYPLFLAGTYRLKNANTGKYARSGYLNGDKVLSATATLGSATPYYFSFAHSATSLYDYYIQDNEYGNGISDLNAGAYITADAAGAQPLIAYAQNPAGWEVFTLAPAANGAYTLKAVNSQYVVSGDSAVMIASGIDPTATIAQWFIEPFVAAEPSNDIKDGTTVTLTFGTLPITVDPLSAQGRIIASTDPAANPTVFTLSPVQSWGQLGVYTLQVPAATNTWVTTDSDYQYGIYANRAWQRTWEWFSFYPQVDGTWALYSVNKGTYLCVNSDNTLSAVSFTIYSQCVFNMNGGPANLGGTTTVWPWLQTLPSIVMPSTKKFTKVFVKHPQYNLYWQNGLTDGSVVYLTSKAKATLYSLIAADQTKNNAWVTGKPGVTNNAVFNFRDPRTQFYATTEATGTTYATCNRQVNATWEWFTFNQTVWTDGTPAWLLGAEVSASLLVPSPILGGGLNVGAKSTYSTKAIDSTQVNTLAQNKTLIWQLEEVGGYGYAFPILPTAPVYLKAANGGYLAKARTTPSSAFPTTTFTGYLGSAVAVNIVPASVDQTWGQTYYLTDASTSGDSTTYLFSSLVTGNNAFFAGGKKARGNQQCGNFPLSCSWIFFPQTNGTVTLATITMASGNSVKLLGLRNDNTMGFNDGTTSSNTTFTLMMKQNWVFPNKRSVLEI